MHLIDGQFKMTPHLPASTIMMSPEWVKMGVEQYFNDPSILGFLKRSSEYGLSPKAPSRANKDDPDTDPNEAPLKIPTPEALARSLGFPNFSSMKKAIENQDFPEPSRHYLLVGCSILADMLTQSGLTAKLDTKFTRFVMSAYLSINEKVEQLTQSDNKIHITWGGNPISHLVENPTPTLQIPLSDDPNLIELDAAPSDPFAAELDKLERALPLSMQLPAYKDPDYQKEALQREAREQAMDDELISILGPMGVAACR